MPLGITFIFRHTKTSLHRIGLLIVMKCSTGKQKIPVWKNIKLYKSNPCAHQAETRSPFRNIKQGDQYLIIGHGIRRAVVIKENQKGTERVSNLIIEKIPYQIISFYKS